MIMLLVRREMTMRFKTMIAASAALGFAGLATAQTPSTPRQHSPLMPLYECLKIDDNAQRLMCLEQNTQSLRVREKNREILAFNAQYAERIRNEAFGFYLPSLPNAGVPRMANANSAASNSRTFKVHAVRKVGADYVFTMAGGQVWRQSGGRFNYVPHGELQATITHESMGDYKIELTSPTERVRGMLVRRIQ